MRSLPVDHDDVRGFGGGDCDGEPRSETWRLFHLLPPYRLRVAYAAGVDARENHPDVADAVRVATMRGVIATAEQTAMFRAGFNCDTVQSDGECEDFDVVLPWDDDCAGIRPGGCGPVCLEPDACWCLAGVT